MGRKKTRKSINFKAFLLYNSNMLRTRILKKSPPLCDEKNSFVANPRLAAKVGNNYFYFSLGLARVGHSIAVILYTKWSWRHGATRRLKTFLYEVTCRTDTTLGRERNEEIIWALGSYSHQWYCAGNAGPRNRRWCQQDRQFIFLYPSFGKQTVT